MRRFEYRLCGHLGFAHPDEMKAALTHRQLADWAAYDEVSPIGPERADLRAALVAWAILQTNSNKKIKLESLLLKFGPPPPPPSPNEMAAKIKRMVESRRRTR